MLVNTRTVGESFRIGDGIKILVAGTNGLSVKLGVDAPRHIQVHRNEVHERIAASAASNEKGVFDHNWSPIHVMPKLKENNYGQESRTTGTSSQAEARCE